jgi:hypothetical protein
MIDLRQHRLRQYLLGLRALSSGQQIALDAGRTGPSSTQCELLYENGRQHDGDGARLSKLLSERIGF